MMTVGIDALNYYVPELFLPIDVLANKRNIASAKLQKGLGLQAMSLMDKHEDTATMAANAMRKLMEEEQIEPEEIHRVYVGTESALDSSKPVATYVLEQLCKYYKDKFNPTSWQHIDAVDLTFACVGAVDALQNCLDFVRANPNKKAVVIASDYAKYKLNSTGEYTQGAGAVAMLVCANPSLLSFDQTIGISTESVFDFFKPRRIYDNEELAKAIESTTKSIEVFSDEPVFDGQYSNQCYKDRLKAAYFDLKKQINPKGRLFDDWALLAFHLPYAFQGRRMFTEIFALENGEQEPTNERLKLLGKSQEYLDFVAQKIAPTEAASSLIGNMYTASIFMALLSGLVVKMQEKEDLSNQKIGFLAYGSGSKSKVLQATLQNGWQEKVGNLDLFETLEQRTTIDYLTYERLHKKSLNQSVNPNYQGFGLQRIEQEKETLIGARYYAYQK